MTTDHFTLTSRALALDEAQTLAEAIDADPRLDPNAVTVNEVDEARGLWAVVGYFATRAEANRAAEFHGGTVAALVDRDWVRESLMGLPPVVAGRFFLYGSHDRERRRPGGISLEIDAGTAFGTGHHGTTEACLAALDGILKHARPRRILDVGCGTGVLAIAAARATGHAALASDIDPEAVRVTIENARRNGTGPLLRAVTAAGLNDWRIAAGAPYDLIFANILARPLAHLASGLAAALAPGGSLILSGLTREQRRWIAATYRNRGLVLSRSIFRGQWATLVFTRANRGVRRAAGAGRQSRPASSGPGWEDA